jgi:L,D-transpeptidase catalytic domain
MEAGWNALSNRRVTLAMLTGLVLSMLCGASTSDAGVSKIDAYMFACPRAQTGFRTAVQKGMAVSPAQGTVSFVGATNATVSHCFYENHEVKWAQSEFDRLSSVSVSLNQLVEIGTPIGSGQSVSVRINKRPAHEFVATHRTLFVPQQEPVLLMVDVDAHRSVRYEFGRATHHWETGQGQAEGAKEWRGDLKTPRGLYYVVEKTTGPFVGDYAAYYGAGWIKINYPNAFDAQRGLNAGVLTSLQANQISTAWWRKELTLQKTKLGGGIGFHGWIESWSSDAGVGLSWGCVVVHPEEMKEFYELIPVGTAVVLM